MDAGIAVALVTSTASILIAAATAVWTRTQNRDLEMLKHNLAQQVRQEEQQAAVKATLAHYREPLLEAARDLQHRLRNITKDQFLLYLDGPRRDATIQTPLFRLARYFGVLESLYSELNYLKFETAEETRYVASLLAEIGRAFASDKYDRTGGFETSKFMIWREEQRAMGEIALWRTGEGTRQVVGYTEFVKRLTSDSSEWFEAFRRDLEGGGGMSRSERLVHI